MNILKSIFLLFKDSLMAFFRDKASIYAAGLAYYMVFSIAPLLVFITAVAGIFIGRSAAGEQVTQQLQYLIGGDLAEFVGTAVNSLMDRSLNTTATVISAVVLLVTAGGIFRQLKVALNQVWGVVEVPPQNNRERLLLARNRVLPFLMVFVFVMLLSLSVILEALLGTIRARFAVLFPDTAAILPQFSRLLIPALTFVTFTLIFKLLPDTSTRWRDTAVGGLVTTILFMIGRWVLSIFLSFSNTGSIYGAASSVVILLFWIYYSAQILLFGAEFTWLYALRFGQPIRPKRLSRLAED